MRLYTVQFGLTELRFYTLAFMGWLVLVFGWFVATVLRGRREPNCLARLRNDFSSVDSLPPEPQRFVQSALGEGEFLTRQIGRAGALSQPDGRKRLFQVRSHQTSGFLDILKSASFKVIGALDYGIGNGIGRCPPG